MTRSLFFSIITDIDLQRAKRQMMKAKLLTGLSATVYLLASLTLAAHFFNFIPTSAEAAEQIGEPIQQASTFH